MVGRVVLLLDTEQDERNEWLRQQDEYIRQLATAQAEVKHQASQIEQLNEDARMHRKAAEIWEQDRKSLLEDRAEKDRLKMLDDEHKEAQRRWAVTQEQLLKERSDSNAQLQLGLQQLEQQQKAIDVHNQEKAQWLRQQDAHHAARTSLETRVNSLETEVNTLKLNNGTLSREKEDLVAKLDRSELDLTESGVCTCIVRVWLQVWVGVGVGVCIYMHACIHTYIHTYWHKYINAHFI